MEVIYKQFATQKITKYWNAAHVTYKARIQGVGVGTLLTLTLCRFIFRCKIISLRSMPFLSGRCNFQINIFTTKKSHNWPICNKKWVSGKYSLNTWWNKNVSDMSLNVFNRVVHVISNTKEKYILQLFDSRFHVNHLVRRINAAIHGFGKRCGNHQLIVCSDQ